MFSWMYGLWSYSAHNDLHWLNYNTYFGSAEGELKKRYNSHTLSFRSKEYKQRNELSKHIWSLQDSNTEFSLKWHFKKKVMPYRPGSWVCDLCLAEKLAIALFERVLLLNKRTKWLSKYWYRNKFIIGWTKWTKTSAVTELIIASLFKYQLNCVIVRVSVECHTPVKVCFYCFR